MHIRYGISIIKTETNIDWLGKSEQETEKKLRKHYSSKIIHYYCETNLAAPIASGSFITDACSCSLLNENALRYCERLRRKLNCQSGRCGIKRGRSLIISPREMPFNAIHLENMLKLSRLGVKVAPPVPRFIRNRST